MIRGETPRNDNPETETNPEAAAEQAVDTAVSEVENRKTTWQKVKGLGNQMIDSPFVGKAFGSIIIRTVGGIFRLAKKIIEKRGNISFKEGYEMGGDIFSLEAKKEKK